MNGPITWAKCGDVVEILGKDKVIEKQMVSHRLPICPERMTSCYCVTHREHFPNLYNLNIHVMEMAEPHHLVAVCTKHNCVEAPQDVQMQALAEVWAA